MCILMKDYRVVFGLGVATPCVIVMILSDAFPPKVRKVTAKFGMTTGALGMMTTIAALYFNWLEVEPIVFQVGFISVSMASLATSSLFNVILFFCRCIVSSIRYESSFVIIKSRMEVIPTTKELADVFMASYELVNAKASSIRVEKKGILSQVLSSRASSNRASSGGMSSARPPSETKGRGTGTG